MTELPESAAVGLPDDVVETLRRFLHLDPWEQEHLVADMQKTVREHLERAGVQVRSPEEALRVEVAQLRTEITSLTQRLERERAAVQRLTGVNQERNATLNTYRARIKALEAQQKLNVEVGFERLAERARTLLAAADIPADVSITNDKENQDASTAAPSSK